MLLFYVKKQLFYKDRFFTQHIHIYKYISRGLAPLGPARPDKFINLATLGPSALASRGKIGICIRMVKNENWKFPNYTSIQFDYLLISWVTNYAHNRGWFRLVYTGRQNTLSN